METLSEKINATKIGIDITEYKSILESHQQKMASYIQTIERFEQRFKNQIRQAKIYPNWAVVVFIISLLFGLGSMSYAYILKQKINKGEKVAFQKVRVYLNDDF